MHTTNTSTPNIYKLICPSRQLLSRIGDKWSVMVLLELVEEPKRFGYLKRTCEGVSQKMLTQTLRQLEMDGLLTRIVIQEKPLQVQYSLTTLGLDLTIHLRPLVDWVHNNFQSINESKVNSMLLETENA